MPSSQMEPLPLSRRHDGSLEENGKHVMTSLFWYSYPHGTLLLFVQPFLSHSQLLDVSLRGKISIRLSQECDLELARGKTYL